MEKDDHVQSDIELTRSISSRYRNERILLLSNNANTLVVKRLLFKIITTGFKKKRNGAPQHPNFL